MSKVCRHQYYTKSKCHVPEAISFRSIECSLLARHAAQVRKWPGYSLVCPSNEDSIFSHSIPPSASQTNTQFQRKMITLLADTHTTSVDRMNERTGRFWEALQFPSWRFGQRPDGIQSRTPSPLSRWLHPQVAVLIHVGLSFVAFNFRG